MAEVTQLTEKQLKEAKKALNKITKTAWIENKDFEGSSKMELMNEYSVNDFLKADYRLSNQVKLNSKGTKYLLCIDTVNNRKSALYMFKAFAASVEENQLLTKDQIAVFHVQSPNEEGEMVDSFVIGTPGFRGGISFFEEEED
jgi:hypothetical protein